MKAEKSAVMSLKMVHLIMINEPHSNGVSDFCGDIGFFARRCCGRVCFDVGSGGIDVYKVLVVWVVSRVVMARGLDVVDIVFRREIPFTSHGKISLATSSSIPYARYGTAYM